MRFEQLKEEKVTNKVTAESIIARVGAEFPYGPQDAVVFVTTPSMMFRAMKDDETAHLNVPLTDEMITALRGPNAYLCLDHSMEGPAHAPRISNKIRALADTFGFPISRILFASHNRNFTPQYEEWKTEAGWTEGYHTVFFNSFIYRLVEQARSIAFDAHMSEMAKAAPRECRFLCFNFAPRVHRILAIKFLLTYGDVPLRFSLGASKHDHIVPESSLELIQQFKTPEFEDAFPALFEPFSFDELSNAATIQAEPPSLEGGTINMPQSLAVEDLAVEEYPRTDFSIVTETDMMNKRVQRITEKTIKPLLFGHAFLVLGHHRALHEVKTYGFETFDPYIDESYDEIVEHNDRLFAVLKEIHRLAHLDPKDLTNLKRVLGPRIRRNMRRGHYFFKNVMEDQLMAQIVRGVQADQASAASRPVAAA